MKKITMVLVLTGCLGSGLSAWAGKACCASKSEAKSAGACAAKAEGAAVMAGDSVPAVQPAIESNAQTICPVMGKPINKSIHVDYNGKRVYLCCSACVSAFMADPEKYLKKLSDDGVQLEGAPAE